MLLLSITYATQLQIILSQLSSVRYTWRMWGKQWHRRRHEHCGTIYESTSSGATGPNGVGPCAETASAAGAGGSADPESNRRNRPGLVRWGADGRRDRGGAARTVQKRGRRRGAGFPFSTRCQAMGGAWR